MTFGSMKPGAQLVLSRTSSVISSTYFLGASQRIARAQLRRTMWCRAVELGAHHSCCPVLQALFMTASVLTAATTNATRTMTKRVFIVTSLSAMQTLSARAQQLIAFDKV
jgi:hypothetical protein